MTNKLKSILAVALLVAAFVLGAVLGWHIKPGADKPEAAEPVKMTVNPAPKEVKKADVAIKVVSKGQLSGVKQLPAVAAAVKDKPPDPVRSEEVETAGVAPLEVTVPVSGTITARYNDAKTGATIGEDTRAISGETVVNVEGDRLQVDTKFEDQVTFAVDLLEPKKLKNEVGYFYDGDQQVYYKRNVFTIGKKFELFGYVGGVLDIDDIDESRVEAGVGMRW
jgi:hypothetical protein